MKRCCKNVNIKDIDLIKTAIQKCLKKKKKGRRDIQRLFYEYKNIDNLAIVLQTELENKQLKLIPIWYRYKYDQGSKKTRLIGIQDIKQQIYDYIAVDGLEELVKSIGKYQCASLHKRGQIYGASAIYRWLNEKENGKYVIRYACKFDVRKYYESIPQDKIITWLHKRVKNDSLLWLIETLIGTFKKGLSIGSYLSQYLGNLYLSDLYHQIQENTFRLRYKKDGAMQKINLVKHTLFYMADLLILGTNSRDLIKASKVIFELLKEKGLEAKDDWRCFEIISPEYDLDGNLVKEGSFIDMMGFRIYRDYIEIRRASFRKIKKSIRKFKKSPNNIKYARTLLSYKGILEHSNSLKFMQDNNLYVLFRKARKVVSKYDKNKILQKNVKCC